MPLRKLRDGVWGIRPRNKEQHCALDLLLCDDIKLVTLVGKAGTGKTMLAHRGRPAEDRRGAALLEAAGVAADLPAGARHRLPARRHRGEAEPLDAADLRQRRVPDGPVEDRSARSGRSYQELIDLGFIEIEPLTYIRGRSIPNQFIIVDEAQNLTPHEVKTIITRVGEATKIVLTGDPYQIDNPYVDATSNGLTTVVEKFKGETVAGHVTLSKGERSRARRAGRRTCSSRGSHERAWPASIGVRGGVQTIATRCDRPRLTLRELVGTLATSRMDRRRAPSDDRACYRASNSNSPPEVSFE